MNRERTIGEQDIEKDSGIVDDAEIFHTTFQYD